MDIFAKQNAAAKKRHASTGSQTGLDEPPRANDLQVGLDDAAMGRDQMPQLSTATGANLREPPRDFDPQVGPSNLAGRRTQALQPLRTQNAPRNTGAIIIERFSDRSPPTSANFLDQLKDVTPQFVESFRAYNGERDRQLEGWRSQCLALKKEKEERLGNVWVPEFEPPEVLQKNKRDAAAFAARKELEKQTAIPVPRQDYTRAESDGHSSPSDVHRDDLDAYGRSRQGRLAALREQQGLDSASATKPDFFSLPDHAAGPFHNPPAIRPKRNSGETSSSSPKYMYPEQETRKTSSTSSVYPDSWKSSSSPLKSAGALPPKPDEGGRTKSLPGPSISKLSSPVPSGYGAAVPISLVEIDLKIKLMLCPAIMLLKGREDVLNIRNVDQIEAAACSAHSLIRLSEHMGTPLGKAIHGRCCYYRGVSRVLRAKADGYDHHPRRWFRRAVADAKGWFPEGTWAEEWLQGLTPEGTLISATNSPISSAKGENVRPTEAGRPTTADSEVSASVNQVPGTSGSWVGGLWVKVTKALRSRADDGDPPPPPFRILHARNRRLKAVAVTQSPLVSPMDTTGMHKQTVLREQNPTTTGLQSPRQPERQVSIPDGRKVPMRPAVLTGPTILYDQVPMRPAVHTGHTILYDHYGTPFSDDRPYFADAEVTVSPEETDGVVDGERIEGPRNLHGGLVEISQLGQPNLAFAHGGARSGESASGGAGAWGTIQEEPNDATSSQSPPKPRYRIVNPDPSSSSEQSVPSVKMGYRIVNPDPSSSSEHSAPSVKTGYHIVNPDPPSSSEHSASPVKREYRIVNPDPSSSSDGAPPAGAITPLHENPRLRGPRRTMSYQPAQQSPTHTPTGKSPSRSGVSSALDQLPFPNRALGDGERARQGSLPATSSGVGLFARRRISQAFVDGMHAIATVREAADPLAKAEEGNSPFLQTSFGGSGSGLGLWKKKSGDDGDGESKTPKTPKSPDEMV
ncbi:hypothetical protein LTR08_001862 [Meristemomyces frigidus]|nr:hypothetical protein LTR08_001862 [Meristemomyces frigidus]